MRCQGLGDLSGVQQPVGLPVETVRVQPCITQVSGQVHRLLKIRSGPFVIATRPQKAQVQDTLPLEASILRLTRGVQRPFVVRLRLLKVAQDLIGLPACPIAGRGHRLPKMLGSLHHARPLFHGGTRRGEGLRLLGSELRVLHGVLLHSSASAQ